MTNSAYNKYKKSHRNTGSGNYLLRHKHRRFHPNSVRVDGITFRKKNYVVIKHLTGILNFVLNMTTEVLEFCIMCSRRSCRYLAMQKPQF